MKRKATVEHRWGVVYAGTVDLETATEAVETASTEIGMHCERHPIGAGGLVIHAVQTRSWNRVFLAAAPQSLEWRLEPRGEETSITADFRLFRWYGVVLVVLGLLIASSLVVGLMSEGHEWSSEQQWIRPILQGLFFVALLLSVVPMLLLGALGEGRQVQAIWQPVLRRVEKARGRLEPQGRTVSRRYLSGLSIYAGIFVFAVGPSLLEAMNGPAFLFVALQLILLLTIVRMFRQTAYMLRSEALLGGLVSVSCAVVYLGLPLLAMSLAPTAEELLTRAGELQRLHSGAAVLPEQEAPELVSLRRFVRGLVTSTVAVVSFLFAALLLHGARLTLAAWVTVWRMQRQGHHGVWNEAVRDPSVLRRFRWDFVTLWGLSTTLVFGALIFNGLCVLQSFIPFSPRPEIRLVELSEGFLALALGRPLGDPAVTSAVRVGWLLYALSGPALLAVSVSQLACAQRGERLLLRGAPAHAELQQVLDRLNARTAPSRVRLVAPETPAVYAYFVVFGLRPERFIVVSSGCLRMLKEGDAGDELEALIAHELSHHLEGHCRLDQHLRWLGRLTLVGDAFALLMQNSWGYEETADRTTVEKFSVSSEALVHCLWKMRHAGAVTKLPPPLKHSLRLTALTGRRDEFEDLLEKGPSALPFKQRWTLTWQIIYEQYFNAISLYYWHPSDQVREETIRSL